MSARIVVKSALLALTIAAACGFAGTASAQDKCAKLSGDKQLDCVNRAVNRQIAPVTDKDHYGRADLWVANPVDNKGDCEDYALTKAARLEALGFSKDRLRIVTGFTARGEYHAVLVVDNAVALDNLSPWLEKPMVAVATYSMDQASQRIVR